MNDLRDRQAAFNRETAANAVWFAGHRARLFDLLRRCRQGPQDRLMVLGAGNANDLELPALCREFAEIHLADIDGDALQRAATKTGACRRGRVQLHPDVDLSRSEAAESLPGAMDLVVSACLLSQMIGTILGDSESPEVHLPQILELRKQHFELLLRLLRPGGSGLFVTDMVSSGTVPGLADTPEIALRSLMDRLLEEANFFTGLNPRAVMQMLYMDPAFQGKLEAIRFEGPWVWQFSEDRAFLVYALTFRVPGSTRSVARRRDWRSPLE